MIILTRYVRVPGGRHVPVTRRGVLRRDNHRCAYCGKAASTIDHVLPRSRGGADSWENLVACCLRCNNVKGDRTPQEINWELRFLPRPPRGGQWTVRAPSSPIRGGSRISRWRPDLRAERPGKKRVQTLAGQLCSRSADATSGTQSPPGCAGGLFEFE